MDFISRLASEKQAVQSLTKSFGQVVDIAGAGVTNLKHPIAENPREALVSFLTTCFKEGKNLWQSEQLKELARRSRQYSLLFSQAVTEAMRQSKLV